jgi:16S rRNA (guanine527-N7)-methyltransferase
LQANEKKDLALKKIAEFHEFQDNEIEKLQKYVSLILQENNNYNLIGRSTIDDIWDRHIVDSAQILQFIDDKSKKIADFGSGAGFPGIVLSILGAENMNLVEKSFRKSEFLHQAKIISDNKIYIHNSKLEEMINVKFNCIVSRALAPLDRLLNYALNFLEKDGYCVFLKGRKLSEELEEARKKYNFEFELFNSLTSRDSNIVKIKNISKTKVDSLNLTR